MKSVSKSLFQDDFIESYRISQLNWKPITWQLREWRRKRILSILQSLYSKCGKRNWEEIREKRKNEKGERERGREKKRSLLQYDASFRSPSLSVRCLPPFLVPKQLAWWREQWRYRRAGGSIFTKFKSTFSRWSVYWSCLILSGDDATSTYRHRCGTAKNPSSKY